MTSLALAALLLLVACDPSDSTSEAARRGGTAVAPGVFFAVRDWSTELVEVESATGRIRRTVVDFGPPGGAPQPADESPPIRIETLDVAPDGAALFFGRFSSEERFAVYRVALPDGTPKRIATGLGPSVSPGGDRLAYADGTSIRVRDLRTGDERTFEDVFGELGGITSGWSADSRRVAFEVEAADSVSPGMLDLETGTVVIPEPAEGPSAGGYTAYSPRYRHTDGALAVVCCTSSDDSPDTPARSPLLVLHDAETGKEKERSGLPFWPRDLDYDASGSNILLVDSEGRVHRDRAGRVEVVPNLTAVDHVAW